MQTYNIALIPGDGIGRDVTNAAWNVLKASAAIRGFGLTSTEFPLSWPSTRKPER